MRLIKFIAIIVILILSSCSSVKYSTNGSVERFEDGYLVIYRFHGKDSVDVYGDI